MLSLLIQLVDAERGFTTMNIRPICSPSRNRLAVERLSNLMLVSLVGPSLNVFDPMSFVKKWLACIGAVTRMHKIFHQHGIAFNSVINSFQSVRF